MRLLFFVHTPLFFQETSVHRHRCHYRRHRLIQTTTITKKKTPPGFCISSGAHYQNLVYFAGL